MHRNSEIGRLRKFILGSQPAVRAKGGDQMGGNAEAVASLLSGRLRDTRLQLQPFRVPRAQIGAVVAQE